MPTTLRAFSSVVAELSRTKKKANLLLGNGFSVAAFPEIFRYGSLLQQADFEDIPVDVREMFRRSGTEDFEEIIRKLENAAEILEFATDDSTKPFSATLLLSAKKLKDALVETIALHHPDHAQMLTPQQIRSCRRFFGNFGRFYILNYDLLPYWVMMNEDVDGVLLKYGDGFGDEQLNEELGPTNDYVVWGGDNVDNQNVHYLHGASHLFDAGSSLQKYTWSRTGVHLKQQIRLALEEGRFPLFVAEGETDKKMTRINRSGYLHRCYRSFSRISGDLVVFGASFGDNDKHIERAIANGKVSRIFVSVYGNLEQEQNVRLISNVLQIQDLRKRKIAGMERGFTRRSRSKRGELEVVFFDAASAEVWDHKSIES